jgi:hypothetical protein
MAQLEKKSSGPTTRRKRSGASIEATCVCGAALPGERRCQHCPDCSAAASRSWRERHKDAIRKRRRTRRENRFSDQKLLCNARAYLAVYISRGKVVPEPCVCGGEEDVRPMQLDPSRPLEVLWKCSLCRADVPIAAELDVAEEPVEKQYTIAPPSLSARRAAIRSEIDALPADLASRFEEEVARRRPRGFPASIWANRGPLWLDAAIAAYDAITGKEEGRDSGPS